MRPERDARLLHWDVRSVLIVTAAWTLLVTLSTMSNAVWARQDGRDFDFLAAFTVRGIDWYSCAVFTPVFIWAARHAPIDRTSWRTSVPLWLALTALATPLKFVIQAWALNTFVAGQERIASRMIVTGFIPELVAFWAMAGVILSIEYYERWRERELQTQVLGRQLAEARLDALAAQLQPHFLFNTLQSISTLLYRDTAAADRMLGELSDLLRRTLNAGDSPEVTLEQELATVQHYLSIQRVRFEDRLRVHIDCDGVNRALVPNFILQPLVENAIEHGVARSAAPGTIEIRARLHDDRLVLEVSDDGCADGSARPGVTHGIGLSNTRARLHALYGDAASITAGERHGGGYAATITLPLRFAGQPA